MRALLAALLLCGCAVPELPQVPAELQVCPDEAADPPPLPRVRTVARLKKSDTDKGVVLHSIKRDYAVCRGRLERLNEWISEHRNPK